jgi:hypothetical protein
MIPIGKLLRKRKKSENKKDYMKILSVEEKILQLESEVQEIQTEDLFIEKDDSGNLVRFISKSNFDRITPLPKKYLPLPFYSNIKRMKKSVVDKRDKRISRKNEVKNEVENEVKDKRSEVEKTYREKLKNYKSISGDKKSFYCRICCYQANDLDDLNQHRDSTEHSIASEIELKMSYCKLCKKQFTSPAQLKEHIQARPHKEKLNFIINKQNQRKSMS